MISKNSYFDTALILDRIRKSAWIVTLYSVILFFSMPVFFALRMQETIGRVMENKEQILTALVSGFFSMNNKFITFLAIPAAIIGAATVFFYLDSKKQMDFYHSLPVKREKLFVTNYLAGVIFYLIPYAGSVILSIIVIAGMGYSAYLTPLSVISGFMFNMLLYIVIYSITVFAMILCGHLVVGLMGTAVFLGYGPLICAAYIEFMRCFYKNFYSELFREENLFRNSSPVFDFLMANQYNSFTAARVSIYIVLTGALIGICLYLYKKRPSEAAGHAITFKTSRPIIKYPIVFLCTLAFGLFFKSVGRNNMAWMIFGFVSGGIISHFVIEIIYHFDFKAIFKNIKGLGVFVLLFAVFISVPAFDMTGYDRRLPQRERIKSVSISIMSFNQNSYFMNMDNMGIVNFMNRERAILNRLTLSGQESIDAALEIAKMGTSNTGSEIKEFDARIGVEYELKSGEKIARRYTYLKSSEIEPQIISIFDTPEFKQKFYGIYSTDNNDVSRIIIQDMYARNGIDRSGQITDINKIIPLMDALRSDILKLKGETMKTETPAMRVVLINSDSKDRVKWEMGIPVYPSFTRTMEIAALLGIEKPKMIPAEMVDYIQINNNEYEKYMAMSYPKETAIEYAQLKENKEVRITEKNQIEEVLKCIIPDNSVDYDPFFKREFGYRANVVSAKYFNGYSESFVFKKDSIPEFIKSKFPMPDSVK